MKTGISVETYRIMRVYQYGDIQFRESVLKRATDLPRDVLSAVLNMMVRDELVTVRCVSAKNGWENLYTLTPKGSEVVQQIKTRRRDDIRYRI